MTDESGGSKGEGSGRSLLPAVVAAGDRGSARPVRGDSKVYLELGGRPLVAQRPYEGRRHQ